MPNHYERERIDNWVGDFCSGDRMREFPAELQALAPEVLSRFLSGACAAGGGKPGDIEEPHVRASLLGDVSLLDIPKSVRGQVPELCGVFLAELEREGRLSGGQALGAFARALRGAFLQAAGEAKPFERPGTPVGRNDPCPCGSGLKYKKCCQRRLDGV